MDFIAVALAYALIGGLLFLSVVAGREENKDKPTEWEKDEAWRRGARTPGSTTRRFPPGG